MKFIKYLLAVIASLAIATAVSAQDAKSLADEMLKAAVAGNEARLLEVKARIDLIPKPERGDRKAARALNDEGLKKLQVDDFAGAISSLENAVQTDRSDVEIANNLGFALLKAKQYDKAHDALFNAIGLAAGRSSAWFNLAQVYGEANDQTNATAAFDIAFTFSQNKDRTNEFLAKFADDTSAPRALAAAAAEALKHQGVAVAGGQAALAEPAPVAPPDATPAPAVAEPVPVAQPVAQPPSPSQVAPAPLPAPAPTTTQSGVSMPLIVIGLLLTCLGAYLVSSWVKKMPSDGQMDAWINEDLAATKTKALSKIGLDESDLVHEQIVIVGPRLESTGGADFLMKMGKDKIVRYTPLNVTILNMTENQLVAYNCCLDLTTGNQLQESTDEYFYRDVVSVSTKTSSFTMKFSQAAKLPGGASVTQMQFNSGEKFVLATSGGTSIEVFLKDDQWQQQLGGQIWTLDVEKAVQAIRKMLREKKA